MSQYDTVAGILHVHAMVNGFIAATVEEVPESRMTEQHGTIVNHPAWTLSHLNAYSALVLSMFDDPHGDGVDREMERFGYGSVPVADPAAYAGKDELLTRFKERNARVGAVVSAKHAEYFARPAPEKFRTHARALGDLAITLIVAHPPHHLGQLNQWRRAAGLAEKG